MPAREGLAYWQGMLKWTPNTDANFILTPVNTPPMAAISSANFGGFPWDGRAMPHIQGNDADEPDLGDPDDDGVPNELFWVFTFDNVDGLELPESEVVINVFTPFTRVIVAMNTLRYDDPEYTPARMQAIATQELGHSLGIEHHPDDDEIMFEGILGDAPNTPTQDAIGVVNTFIIFLDNNLSCVI